MRIGQPLILRALAVAVVAGAVVVSNIVPATAAPAFGVVTGVVKGSDGFALEGVVVEAIETPTIPIPLPGQVVASAVSASDGTYRLRIPAGSDGTSVRFRADNATGGTSPTGYADGCSGNNLCALPYGGPVFAVPAGHTIALGVWRLAPAAELRGRLVDSLGRGVGNFPVELANTLDCFPFDDAAYTYGVTTTDVNGNYRIGRLQAISATACWGGTPYVYDAHAGTPARDGYNTVVRNLSFTAGKVTVANLTLAQRAALAGNVVDQFGSAVEGAVVQVTGNFGVDTAGANATTTALVRFRVGGIPLGTFEWCVNAPMYDSVCHTTTFTAGRTAPAGTVVLHRIS